MPITDIYSKRQKKLRGDIPDVYAYDDLPKPLRAQIVQIWWDTLGNKERYHNEYKGKVKGAYRSIVDDLRREHGVFQLHPESRDPITELVNFFLNEGDVEKALDAVELSFRFIDFGTRDYSDQYGYNSSERADDAIEELNARFKEHGVGYQFTDGQIIRIDSEFIHTETVKPALKLLNQPHYAGAQQEFLKAHEHYLKGNAKEALNECLKAFESVMKAICDKRGWSYDNKATVKSLIKACFDNELIPLFWQSHYSSLRKLLECSVPTVRNKLSGHGQGTTPVSVQNHIVAYTLHMTASAIVFLAEAEEKAP